MDPFEICMLQEFINSYYQKSDEDITATMLPEAYEDRRDTLENFVKKKNNKKCVKIMDATTIMLISSPSSTFKLLNGYSKAIAYAPNDSAELGRAYGNRSAILCNAQLYEDSIKDIDRALGLNYPDNLKSKLYIRKAKNLLALGSEYKLAAEQAIAEARHWMEKLSDADKSTQEIKLKKLCKQNSFKEPFKKPDNSLILPDIVDPHEQLIGASKAIELKYSEKFGRHFVATRDIKPGETLVKTQAHVVLPSNLNYSHCWNCAKRAWAGIPCKNCVNFIFCNEKCRDEAWNNFHDIECAILTYILESLSNSEIMGMRIVIKSLKEAGSIASLKELVERINSISDPILKGFSDGKLDGSKFASTYNLNSRRLKSHNQFCKSFSTSIAWMLYGWATTTDIFGKRIKNFNESRSNTSLRFMGDLLFENMIICSNNSFAANFYQEEEESSGMNFDRGSILSCLTSYFNHSCDCNAYMVHSGDVIGVRVIQRIQKGHQVFLSYQKGWEEMPKFDRQMNLLMRYGFVCECHACKGDWGPQTRWPSMNERPLPFKVKTNLSKAFDKFEKHFKGISTLEKNYLMSTDARYITPISELLNTLYKETEYPCDEILLLLDCLIRNYQSNKF